MFDENKFSKEVNRRFYNYLKENYPHLELDTGFIHPNIFRPIVHMVSLFSTFGSENIFSMKQKVENYKYNPTKHYMYDPYKDLNNVERDEGGVWGNLFMDGEENNEFFVEAINFYIKNIIIEEVKKDFKFKQIISKNYEKYKIW